MKQSPQNTALGLMGRTDVPLWKWHNSSRFGSSLRL